MIFFFFFLAGGSELDTEVLEQESPIGVTMDPASRRPIGIRAPGAAEREKGREKKEGGRSEGGWKENK